MSIADYAEHIGVSIPTVRRYIKDGTIPSSKVGTRRTIKVKEADEAYDRWVARKDNEYRQVLLFEDDDDEAIAELKKALDEMDDF